MYGCANFSTELVIDEQKHKGKQSVVGESVPGTAISLDMWTQLMARRLVRGPNFHGDSKV